MGRKFIFRLDILLFYIGIVPSLLAIVFALKPGDGQIKKGWLIFAAVCFLVSLQQSRLYLLLFHVPFFNLFRSYFLYIVFVVFAVLVMSAYGLDYLLGARAEARAALVRRATLWLVGFCMVSALILLGLTLAAPDPRKLIRELALPLLMDAGLIIVGIVAFRQLVRVERPGLAAVVLLGGLVLPQIAYFAQSYEAVGTTISQAYAKFGLDDKDTQPAPTSRIDTDTHRRKLCTKFAQCYLSSAATVSLNTDLEGTFLRNREEPVFQHGLARPVQEALTGLTHPVFWFSRGAITHSDPAKIVAELNAGQHNMSERLGETVYLRKADIAVVGEARPTPATHAKISTLFRRPDSTELFYESDHPIYLNAAVNYDARWNIQINGQNGALVKGNFGGIAALLPAGKGNIRLRYDSNEDGFLFFSRFGFLVLSLLAMARIVWTVKSRQRDTQM